ncbi:NDR1/HIN1-like protein [Thalictrum thalictroides]|uniref:NDR1/HIN1-like protein n=1 Tax=Thalictrum thalictroides TaxID=46969 RepID=A0A7J6V6S7_THATH|nr:NDR1/HIN1-like protein [Thalictrum thalictroides]
MIIFVIVIQPVNVKFHVVNASLSEFNFITNTTTIVYNLSIEARVRNPNKKIGYYYHRIDAKAFYEKKQFAYIILSDRFYQGHKNTTMLRILFKGNSSIPLRGSKLEGFSRKFDKAKSNGAFNIYIRFGVRSRYKIGNYKSSYSKPKIHCGLRVPLLTNGTSTVFFCTTTCDVGSPLAMDDGEE